MLTKAGAEDYIPLLAKKGVTMKQVSYMNDKQLLEVLSSSMVPRSNTAFMFYPFHPQLGVHNAYLRQRIIECIQTTIQSSKLAAGGNPSAPVATDLPSAPAMDTPSAPPAPLETYQSNECVVCMENKVRVTIDAEPVGHHCKRVFFVYFQCNIIFLPCGHVCSCWRCETGLTDCPLCRAPITQKVRLN